MSLFAKEPLIIGLFCGKWPLKIRHPMGLHHPIANIAVSWFLSRLLRIFESAVPCLPAEISQRSTLQQFYISKLAVIWLLSKSTWHTHTDPKCLRSPHVRYNFSKVSSRQILPSKMAMKVTFENFHLTYAQSPETPARRAIFFLKSLLTANFTIYNGYDEDVWEFPPDICTKPRNSREADTIPQKSAHG